jgi:hypothetical protein
MPTLQQASSDALSVETAEAGHDMLPTNWIYPQGEDLQEMWRNKSGDPTDV